MDREIAREFKNIESIVLESILTKKADIVEYAKSQQVQGAIEGTSALVGEFEDKKVWHNWAGNIWFEPEKILYPKSVDDLKNYVKDAQKNGKKIRCSAQGHSWSSLSVTSDYLVILDKLKKVDVEKRNDGWVVNSEAGASISEIDTVLRNHNPPLTITSMTVLDNVRISGVVAPGCHGATIEARTIPDQVVGLQIVTGDGELHEFSDAKNHEEMEAARVSLGLLGIIYRVILRVVPMYDLRMIDTQPLRTEFNAATLKNLVLNSDGIQLFYWPFNSPSKDKEKIWIKRWVKSAGIPVTLDDLEQTFYRIAQNATTKIANTFYQQLLQTPEKTPVITNLAGKLKLIERDEVWKAPDAIHYQAGISNIPCEDSEFAIKADKNFENVLTELNHVIDRIYDYDKENKYPINLVVEMRILKSSSCTLSFIYDEDPDAYYFFIEVLSIKDTPLYKEFSIELAQRWIEKYKALPHWAKLWEYVPNIHEYLRNQLGERIKKFETVRERYDPRKIFFDNQSLERVFYGN